LKHRREIGVGDEVLPVLLIPVEEHPDPTVLIGIAKTVEPLDPCCFRVSTLLVEKIFIQRSKSSTLDVARINSPPSWYFERSSDSLRFGRYRGFDGTHLAETSATSPVIGGGPR